MISRRSASSARCSLRHCRRDLHHTSLPASGWRRRPPARCYQRGHGRALFSRLNELVFCSPEGSASYGRERRDPVPSAAARTSESPPPGAAASRIRGPGSGPQSPDRNSAAGHLLSCVVALPNRRQPPTSPKGLGCHVGSELHRTRPSSPPLNFILLI